MYTILTFDYCVTDWEKSYFVEYVIIGDRQIIPARYHLFIIHLLLNYIFVKDLFIKLFPVFNASVPFNLVQIKHLTHLYRIKWFFYKFCDVMHLAVTQSTVIVYFEGKKIKSICLCFLYLQCELIFVSYHSFIVTSLM